MTNTLKHISWVVALLCCTLTLGSCYDTEDRAKILKVYNWADYIDEDVLAEFPAWYKEQTGEEVEVIYQTFDINEIMLTKIERGHEDYDVVCPSEYIIERMLKKDLLLPIDTAFGSTPNYIHNQSAFIRNELNKVSQPERLASDYAVGFMWGTTGLLFNTDKVPVEDALTWKSLWDKRYEKQILMKESYRDCYGTALIYAHRHALADGTMDVEDLMNNYTPAAIDTAETYLKAMKPFIAGWEADFGKEMMTKGKALLNLTWSGDAVWAIEEAAEVGINLDYEVPTEGSNVWYDGWVIPKYARNHKAASYFINYLCMPDVALRNMDAIGYVSAIATPEVLEAKIDTTLDYTADLSYFFGPEADSIPIDKVQYPDRSVIERCAMIRDAGDHTEEVLEMWARVKGDNLGAGVVIVILLVVGAMTSWTIYRKWEAHSYERAMRRRRRKRRKK